jgi:hypothetical protein
MLAILNSLAEYFYLISGKIQLKEPSGNIEKKHIYVIYRGKTLEIYVTFEEVIAQQIENKDIDQALSYARSILGVNYF